MTKRIVIYRETLNTTESEITKFLDEKLNEGLKWSQDKPDLGFFIGAYKFHRGTSHDVMQKALQEHERRPAVGDLELIEFWDNNRWIILAALGSGDGPFSLREFYSGHIEIKRPYADLKRPVEIHVVSDWPVMRAYWEWIAKCLRYEFMPWSNGEVTVYNSEEDTPPKLQLSQIINVHTNSTNIFTLGSQQVNRSGGIDVNANQDVNIQGDLMGNNKVATTVTSAQNTQKGDMASKDSG